jgi:transcriptional regulator with XRE-family HTH domain
MVKAMPVQTESIAEKIKRYRKLKEMSQEELSQLSGINVSTIKKYECGLRNPKPDQLLKIASALGVSVNSFLSYDITSISDILCLIMKLHKEANMTISGKKDSEGHYIPETISMAFSDSDINMYLAKYLEYFETKGIEHIDNISYQYELDGILLNIEQQS